MQEIEAKFFVHDLTQIQRRLHQMEARLIHDRAHETNLRFDLPGGGLSSKGLVLRLRRDSVSRLTYKSAGYEQQGILSRTEIELVVDDFENAKHLLESLGYQIMFVYEKYRTTYALDDVHIMLDELPYGEFIEIEGGELETIQAAAAGLNLNWEAAIAASYHSLFNRLCTAKPQLDPGQLTFQALHGLRVLPEDLSITPADR